MNDAQAPQAPARLEELKRKMKLTGTITKVVPAGALVDVGIDHDGRIHISQLSARPVTRVEDVVKEGDTVTVWVREVDAQAGRLDLTLIEPLAVEWNELKPGQVYPGKVIKLEKFGAFVDIGAERPGLVHISELANHRVEDVTEVVKLGEEVQVKVLGVDPRKRQIKLSVKAAELAEPVPAEDEPAPRTAMQLAMERARQQATDERHTAGRRKDKADRSRRDLEDILARTLANKRK